MQQVVALFHERAFNFGPEIIIVFVVEGGMQEPHAKHSRDLGFAWAMPANGGLVAKNRHPAAVSAGVVEASVWPF